MSTELYKGGNFTKILVKGLIIDKENNQNKEFRATAIKTKNKITYSTKSEKTTIKILSPSSLILKRENQQTIHTMYFEKNKIIPSIYKLKENDITLEIDIKTTFLLIEEHKITIKYMINNSGNEFEYVLEMSE